MTASLGGGGSEKAVEKPWMDGSGENFIFYPLLPAKFYLKIRIIKTFIKKF